MGKHVRRPLQVLVTALVSALFAAGGGGAASSADVTFPDPTGDATGGAADIVSVAIRADDRAKLTFTIELANRPTGLRRDEFVHIFLDTDRNASTGSEDGYDYAIQADEADETAALFQRKAERWTLVSAETLGATNAQSVWINARELGETTALRAYFETNVHSKVGNDAAGPVDFAVPVAVPGPRRLSVVSLTTRPSPPKAGKELVVQLVVQRDETGDVVPNGTVRCSATIGKKVVKKTAPGHFFEIIGAALFGEQSAALCSYKVPRGSRGRTIKGSISVVSFPDGLRLSRAFAFPIR